MNPPRPGTLAYVRAWHGDKFKRGALARVGDRKVWIARALPDGRVSVYGLDGPSFPVNPSEVHF